ncbi:MAG: hypothetical protein AAFZ15_27755 [Bacteroidota bacterium]
MKISVYTISLLLFPLLSFSNDSSLSDNHLYLELREISPNNWGVYVSHDNILQVGDRLHTGSGQVTIVAPAGFTYFDFVNHGGTWVENARVTNPVEARGRCYISFGFVVDQPKVELIPNESTLLFSFKTEPIYFGQFQLFENKADPFETPNSYGTNPGNDLGMIAKTDNNVIKYLLYAHNIHQPGMSIYSESGREEDDVKAILMTDKK